MTQNKFTFQSENLVVDWIGFNIQGFVNLKQVEIIANYLFQNLGFNSTFAIGLDGKEKILFNDSKNKYRVYFRAYRYSDIYWDGIKIDFSGQNGHQFYKLIVANQVNWKILNHKKSLTLSRLDLCYLRSKTNIGINIEPFLQQCYQKVSETNAIKNFSLQRNYSNWILKIGKRGSPNHYRIYDNQIHIRFELEQRGSKIKSVQKLIFENQIDNFEQVMTETFFNYSKKVLAIDENYTDWLMDHYRKQNPIKNSLVTGYFNQKSANSKLIDMDEKRNFFRFLQFLAFSRTQKANTKFFWDQPYSIVQFKVIDFMDFIKIKNKNQYQRKQLIQFFDKLQTMKPFLKILTNDNFQSFVIFPAIKARKEFGEYGPWIVEVAILQELYFYNYRFFLPNYFLTYQKDFELQIKLHFIQTYSSQSLRKTFYVSKILDQYKHTNNQKKAQLKQLIQYSFQQALAHKVIQDHCQVEFKNKGRKPKSIQIKELNSLIIGQSDTINFYERLF
jgi:hypothetical protein